MSILTAREELFQIAGDVPDPTGGDLRGQASAIDLTRAAAGHPIIRYKDVVIEADVYQVPGAPVVVVLLCPRCRNSLRVSGDRKRIEWSPTFGPRLEGDGPTAVRGTISIEPFECTWELEGDRRIDFGIGLCRWKVAVDHNLARDL